MSEEILGQLKAQTAILATISRQISTLTQANAPISPNYRRRLSEYKNFDWASIGATVIARDAQEQVDEVEWHGHRFDRAKGEKFGGQFIIFSRPAEGWTQTNKVYCCLIRFADYNDTKLVDEPQSQAKPASKKTTTPTPPPPTINPVEIYAPAPPPAATNGTTTITDAPEFYALVNQLIKYGHKNIYALVGQIVADPATNWGEKAEMLRQETSK